MMNEFKQILQEAGLPTEETEIRQHFERLTDEQGLITNTSHMSPFWRLVTAIAVKPVKWLTDQLIVDVLPNLFVKTAKGKWLQIQAWSVGLDFKPAAKAQGYVTFFKDGPQMTVKIEAGTVIQTERINERIYRLIVTTDNVIPEGKASGKILVEAEQAGADYNLANGYYKILPTAIGGIARVVNEANWLIVPGADKETDDELRERYRTQFSSVGKHHIDSVYRGLVAKISGLSVNRIYFKHDAPRGPGTANIYLLLDTGVPAQPFIDRVNRYLMEQGYHGHGDDIQAMKMDETQHQIAVKVYFDPRDNLSEQDKQNYLGVAEQMIRCAFRENNEYNVTKTAPFTRFSWSKLGEEIHEQVPQIKSLAWQQVDIISELNIPRIQSLNVSEEV